MDVTTFRTAFPEFGTTPGTGAFTDARINFWIAVAGKLLTSARWGELLDFGTELYIAHHLTLDAANQKAAAIGGNVGQATGPLSQKAVGDVSASFDTQAASIEGAAQWNLTTYGIQFYQLARMIGAGGMEMSPAFDARLTTFQL